VPTVLDIAKKNAGIRRRFSLCLRFADQVSKAIKMMIGIGIPSTNKRMERMVCSFD
jgi:hypothetical protein